MSVEAEQTQEKSGVKDTVRVVIHALILALLVRVFLFQPFNIPSGSMIPTLLVGDLILVNKNHYGVRLPVINKKIIANNDPQRGDVMVFRYPVDPRVDYIKHVVGVPGDEVAVAVKDQPARRRQQAYLDAVLVRQKLELLRLVDLHEAHAKRQNADDADLHRAEHQATATDQPRAFFGVFLRPLHSRCPKAST